MAESKAAKTTSHTVVQFTGHVGTRRVISKKDQDRIVGVDGVAQHELVWEPGNAKLVVTDYNLHEDVVDYLKHDGEFRFTTVDAPAKEQP